ncbi:blue copper protein-like [Hibiscus syriacus]|nr:blue copper protein-like [Hibiscus syriacus]
MAMKFISTAALVSVVLASTVLQSTYAATYTVGDNTGWTVPTGGNTEFYDNWADNKNFLVGDILVFNFATGSHNVAEVTEAVYDSCNVSPVTVSPDKSSVSMSEMVPGLLHPLPVQAHRTRIPGSGPNGSPSSASSLVAAVSLAIMSIALVLLY